MDSAASSVFIDVEPAAGGDRGRNSLFVMGRLKIAGRDEELSVRVRNVSAGGLMAELPEPVPPDSAMQIELRGLGWVAGRVAWQTEGRAGIAFDRPIDPQLVLKPAPSRKGSMRFPS